MIVYERNENGIAFNGHYMPDSYILSESNPIEYSFPGDVVPADLSPYDDPTPEYLLLKKEEKRNQLDQVKRDFYSEGVLVNGIEKFNFVLDDFELKDNVKFDFDNNAVTKYNQIKLELIDDPNYENEEWKSANGFIIKMNGSTHGKVMSALNAKENPFRQWYKTKIGQIELALDKAALDAIDLTYVP